MAVGGGKPTLYSSASGSITQVTSSCPVGNHWAPDINACGDIVFTSENAGTWTVYRLGNNAPCFTFPAVSSVTLTPNVASPQNQGSVVTFTAQGSGGSRNYEYQFWLKTGDIWAMVQNFDSGLSAWNWDTGSAAAGVYQLQVRARNAGSTKLYEALKTISYTLVLPATTGLTVSISAASPQYAGTPITFTGQGSGGTGSYEYQFWLETGTTWALVQDYTSGLDNWTWDTTTAAKGSYLIQVRVRTVGSSKAYDIIKNVGYSLNLAPVTGLDVSASAASPQYTGTYITITGQGSGGTGNYEYQFWLMTGTTWAMVQDYTSGLDNWTWDTTTAAKGSYLIQVRVRSAGALKAYDIIKNIGYALNLAPATGLDVSISAASPQYAGAQVTFTGQGSGGTGSYEYQFWLKTGDTWAMVQDYNSGLDNWLWNTSPVVPGSYQIQIRVRSAGSGGAYHVIKNRWYVIK